MYTLNGHYTTSTNFFNSNDVFDLVAEYGSPLYVYNEDILRLRCKEMKNLVTYNNFVPHFSIKANTNIHLLKIVKEEGLHVDAMSPGEIFLALNSGFTSDEIFFIPNNATDDDLLYAIEHNILTSVDSLSQLERYGKLNPHSQVAIRFNPGIGVGHHEKVITAGKNTKFGVNSNLVPEIKTILNRYNLRLSGINQHIGSLFMDATPYIDSTVSILSIAKQFDNLNFIDLGGGFGVPYHKQEGEARLDLKTLGKQLDKILSNFVDCYGKDIQFQIEPGRYITCESGILLGNITDIKANNYVNYLGTDIGFNVFQRPVMYDAYHDLEIYSKTNPKQLSLSTFTVVGNICESGDILAHGRMLPSSTLGNIIGVMDAGAYGFSMASSYNQRLRPAELLIMSNGLVKVIRKRETFEDLIRNML